MNYFAFDFDGVICNSAGETGRTAWRAAHEFWPGLVPATPTPEFIEQFPRLRPVIETGYENVSVVGLYARGVEEADMLENFQEMAADLIAKDHLDAEEMRASFGKARDAWIAEDLESWLAAQGFYPGVVEAINAMSAPRCIITTKEDRFTRVLVERAGLQVDSERIYALESFEKGGKRSVLASLAEEFPHAQLHFFEDRFVTLDKIRDMEALKLYLVDWGYNTEKERARAADDTQIKVLNPNTFEALLSASGH